jgi:hypothetical protein
VSRGEVWQDWIEYPEGRKLPSPPTGKFGTIYGAPQANDEHLRVARRNWPERDPEDFIPTGKTYRERANGQTFEPVRGNPLLGDAATSTVSCFLVGEDGSLIFLRREGADKTTTTLGEVTA